MSKSFKCMNISHLDQKHQTDIPSVSMNLIKFVYSARRKILYFLDCVTSRLSSFVDARLLAGLWHKCLDTFETFNKPSTLQQKNKLNYSLMWKISVYFLKILSLVMTMLGYVTELNDAFKYTFHCASPQWLQFNNFTICRLISHFKLFQHSRTRCQLYNFLIYSLMKVYLHRAKAKSLLRLSVHNLSLGVNMTCINQCNPSKATLLSLSL